MLLLSALTVAAMGISSWMAQSIQGNAHAINKAGSLRMQSYRLLAAVPLRHGADTLLNELEQDESSDDLLRAVEQEGLSEQFNQLRNYWRHTLRPTLITAQAPQQASAQVAEFVHQLDRLVSAIDQKTEQRLTLVSRVQRSFIGLTLLLLVLSICYLRRRLLGPWRELLAMATAIGRGDFSQRFSRRRQDEMGTLGEALNAMSRELSVIYGDLERRVAEKTIDLQQKNQILAFLYRSSRQLHSHEPLCSRLLPILSELQTLTPLRGIRLHLYENNHSTQYREFSCSQIQRPQQCPNDSCYACLQPQDDDPLSLSTLRWQLDDQLNQYGAVLAQYPSAQPLNAEQQQLVDTLIEQLTSTLALERQADHQQQLLLMEERSAIACELHDSIAQSLSCLKIQIACLQMQCTELPPESQAQLKAMREELNSAYRQLRELLTTFRLKLSEPGLLPALQATVEEFDRRLGFPVELDYQLSPQSVPPHQAIHLVQITREALSNIVKHARASRAWIVVEHRQGEVILTVSDNGCGLPEDPQRLNHYGLIIMRDRANSLHGQCTIANRPAGGAEVCVRFRPDTGQ